MNGQQPSSIGRGQALQLMTKHLRSGNTHTLNLSNYSNEKIMEVWNKLAAANDKGKLRDDGQVSSDVSDVNGTSTKRLERTLEMQSEAVSLVNDGKCVESNAKVPSDKTKIPQHQPANDDPCQFHYKQEDFPPL